MAAKSRTEMERIVVLFSSHEIRPEQSMWGKHYNLSPDEIMIQYRILWDSGCPLDVVYDTKGEVKAVFTSYE